MTMALVNLKLYELRAIIEWHRAEENVCAKEQNYIEAQDHKNRIDQLDKILKDAIKNIPRNGVT